MARAGRPSKWGQPTQWKSIRIPEGDYRHLQALARKAGVNVPDAHHAMICELKMGGESLERQIMLRAELEVSQRAHLETARRSGKLVEALAAQVLRNQSLRGKLVSLTALLRRLVPAHRLAGLQLPKPEPVQQEVTTS